MATQATTRLALYTPSSETDKTRDLLLAMIEHAPFPAGQQNIVNDVNSCESDNALHELGARFLTGLFILMRAEGGKTLPLSETSPPRNELIEPDEVKLDSTQTKVKRLVMTRDDYRCQVSGMLDKNSVIRGTISHSAGQRVVSTVAAHIIPLPVILSPQSGLTSLLSQFSGVDLDELQINGLNIENMITLGLEIYSDFGALYVWLEAVPNVLDTYVYRKLYDFLDGPPDGTRITFTSSQASLRLPNPKYLAIHAACARVVHMAGIAKVVDKMLDDRDSEDMPVLSSDGLLHSLLQVASHSV